MNKLDILKEAISKKGRLLVFLSGGLDSTFLAKVASDMLGDNVHALTFDSSIIPSNELENARDVAKYIGIRHTVLKVDELSVPEFALNPPNRCYLCRKLRDRQGMDWAGKNGFLVMADGLNASDLSDYRPGIKAAKEDNVWQPLAELGISKEEIRAFAKELGLPGWDKPNTVCLCSRFPYGVQLRKDLLDRVEYAETFIKNLGIKQLRLRYFPYECAVIEVGADDLHVVLQHKDHIVKHLLTSGFCFVTLDLEGFASGKLNRVLGK